MTTDFENKKNLLTFQNDSSPLNKMSNHLTIGFLLFYVVIIYLLSTHLFGNLGYRVCFTPRLSTLFCHFLN